MKLSVLAAQYFYQHRQLNLPGIGSFYLDDAVTIPDMSDKNFRDVLQYIQFKQQNIQKPDDAFIDFIRTHTGKIKPLAESDLESYVGDGKLLLNIGKPFHIEGIGTLNKNKAGIYEFTPGEPMLERLEMLTTTEKKEAEKHAKKKSVFDEDYYPHESNNNSIRRRALIGAVVLIGLTIIIWGGYSLYNRNVQPAAAISDTNTVSQVPDAATLQLQDSLARAKAIADSLEAAGNGTYKFILETTASKRRALRRHQQVNDISPRIQMETNDSSLFKIFVVLPATPADTVRIKDSLNAWYYGVRQLKVYIEQ